MHQYNNRDAIIDAAEETAAFRLRTSAFDWFRTKQDNLFNSDFEREAKRIEGGAR